MFRPIALGSTLALVLASPVLAGPCTEQISDLQKVLASSDAGSGPTMRTGSTQPQASGTATSAMPRQVPRAGETPQTEATAGMNTATQGKATSPQDVRAQTQGQPTSSQTASGAVSAQDRVMQVQTALDRARLADQAGDANGCTSAVNQAKSLLGTP